MLARGEGERLPPAQSALPQLQAESGSRSSCHGSGVWVGTQASPLKSCVTLASDSTSLNLSLLIFKMGRNSIFLTAGWGGCDDERR